MAKKKAQTQAAWCGECAERIDLDKLNAAMKADRTYVHYCGRVLYWGGNAEVLPNRSDDADSDITSKSSNPTTGDA